MKVLIVLAHPRDDSLVYSIKNEFEKGLKDSGHEVNTLDLYKIGFDPVLREQDEPKFSEETHAYTEEVYREMERINEHDAVVFAFPLYWSTLPAIMKGYIDRVWNYRFAYGIGNPTTMKLNKVFWIATTGATESNLTKRNIIEFVNHYFNVIVAGYCNIKNSRVKLFHDTHNKELVIENHIPKAYQQGLDFDKW